MGRPTGRVQARGSCPAGHVTEVTTDPGRTTWNGTCAHEGCEAKVLARRVPATRVEAPAGAPVASPPPDDPDAMVVVSSYDDPGSAGQPAFDEPARGPVVDDADELDPSAGVGPAAPVQRPRKPRAPRQRAQQQPEPAPEPQRPGRRGRLRGFLGGGGGAGSGEELYPGIY